MGMDVYGKNGNYFRNSVWWWRPLADYCLRVAPELKDSCKWHTNDGEGLDEADSLELADLLQAQIDEGACLRYQQDRDAAIAAMPDVECSSCKGEGKHPENPDRACLNCKGSGKTRPWESWYGFDVENVQNFVVFLRESGGFEIH